MPISFWNAKEAARKAKKDSFTWNGNTYKLDKSIKNIMAYRKVGKKKTTKKSTKKKK